MPAAGWQRRVTQGFLHSTRFESAHYAIVSPKKIKRPKPRPGIDFDLINSAALRALPAILGRWLPHGRRQGPEYVALNPTRNDQRLGSFRINSHWLMG